MGYGTLRWIGFVVLTFAFAVADELGFPQEPGKPARAGSENLDAILSDWVMAIPRKSRHHREVQTDRSAAVAWFDGIRLRHPLEELGIGLCQHRTDRTQAPVRVRHAGCLDGARCLGIPRCQEGDHRLEGRRPRRLRGFPRFGSQRSGWGRFTGNQFDFDLPRIGQPEKIRSPAVSDRHERDRGAKAVQVRALRRFRS